MPAFTHHLIATRQPSVRMLLQSLGIPKKWQAALRLHRDVLIAGAYRPYSAPVAAGEPVTIRYRVPDPTKYRPNPGPLTVVYEDAFVLVIDKPAGIKSHPNRLEETNTVMNRVAAYLAPQPAYITHRLDMATSGLMLIAKDPLAQAMLNQQLAKKTMTRTYQALVPRGLPAAGEITAPIGPDPSDPRKRMVRPDGQAAVTHYRRLAETATTTRLELTLATGRTHQLRVHLAWLGYPILGDPLYAPASPAPRLMLHATQLSWHQPLTGRPLAVTSPAPF